ncbi:HlyD family secretion protein [Lysinibacillus sp. Bpr_S20]|uniref:HlyD family secretion protein n=2 Tax=unclassified Lysinibacillus TaxID=2636778 RepID=UPI0020139FCD|nr:HlyD family secretion protein [Lysinibacillus sp. Bpr_S20]MCL1695859.1 HlyD family secretion protein [Lysinibacillus sp. BPa_S21]MCL1699895.1 HlyD family secretion protein [Lysinibacillus sp. Bpr_S20]
MMRFIKSRPWTILSIIVIALLIGVNAYFVFKDDSKVARSYFIDEFQIAATGERKETVEKDAIVAPSQTYTISADAKSLSAIDATRGQEVHANDLLATYKTEKVDGELTKLEAERTAYETELSDLESALAEIESEYGGANDPKSSINTDQISEKLNVSVKFELGQQATPSTAVAILNRHIAETNREVALLDARIEQIKAWQGVICPVDGVISKITEEAGTVTFEIYSAEKSMLAYLSEDEWQKVEDGQTVTFKLPHNDGDLSGTVVQKQKIAMNTESLWANELAKTAKLPKPTSYEVILHQDDILDNIPFSTVGKAAITVNEASNAFKVKSAWVKSRKNNKHSIYTIDENGKIRLEDIQVAFKTADSTIFSSYLEAGTPIIANEQRNILARSFRSIPLEKIKWQDFKKIGWKDYVKYIVF